MLNAIVAMSENQVIGIDNRLPWHLPLDLKHFKSITLNHSIVMGRKTYESIGKPLPQRTNIVLTRDTSFQASGCVIKHHFEEIIEASEHADIFIIGGADIFKLAMPSITKLYLTLVHAHIEGDVVFPRLNPDEWQTVKTVRHENQPLHDFDFTFLEMVRKNNI